MITFDIIFNGKPLFKFKYMNFIASGSAGKEVTNGALSLNVYAKLIRQ
jgi:hypothetical protein